jgi:hypothetical protein
MLFIDILSETGFCINGTVFQIPAVAVHLSLSDKSFCRLQVCIKISSFLSKLMAHLISFFFFLISLSNVTWN